MTWTWHRDVNERPVIVVGWVCGVGVTIPSRCEHSQAGRQGGREGVMKALSTTRQASRLGEEVMRGSIPPCRLCST